MRSTSASARSARSPAGVTAAPVAAPGPPPAPWTSGGGEGIAPAGSASGVAGRGAAGHPVRAPSPAWSAERSSSAARVSSRAVDRAAAFAPSISRSRAALSISVRACPRRSAARQGRGWASLAPAEGAPPVGRRRGGAPAPRTGRSVRARSSSSNRFRGGGSGCSLRGGSTRSGSMPTRAKTRFVPAAVRGRAARGPSSPRDDRPLARSPRADSARPCASTCARSVRSALRTGQPPHPRSGWGWQDSRMR